MDFRFKEDWPEARERLLAWWQGELVDRAVIKVTAPKNVRKKIPPPKNMTEKWTDADYVIAANEAAIESAFWGGEAIPNVFVNLGPSIMGAFLGCQLSHNEDTGWQHPIIHQHEDWEAIKFDPDNHWWVTTKRLTQALAEAGKGKYFVTMTDLGGPVDVMSYMRTPEELCMDLVEIPETLFKVRDQLTDLWFQFYDELDGIIRNNMDGSMSWLRVWSPGTGYTPQCDFSCMISPAMFRELVLPELTAQVKRLDHTIYHLDGPGALLHLDALLEIPELNGIQWVPGAGAPPEKDWPDVLKRIQAAGKLLHIHVAPNDIEGLLEVISPKGLMIDTACGSQEEAEDLLRKAESWTAKAVKSGRA